MANYYTRRIAEKTCECGRKHAEVNSIGYYLRAKWRNLMKVCSECYGGRSHQMAPNTPLIGYRGETVPDYMAK